MAFILHYGIKIVLFADPLTELIVSTESHSPQQRVVFHVPFRLGYAISGGGIRPGKMIAAFEQLGYAVDVISGNKAQRMEAMAQITERIKRGADYAFCYAESSVLPTMLTEKDNKPFYPFVDFDFFAMLKAHGIKCGLFYRDIFWKFKYFTKKLSTASKLWRRCFYHLDFHYYDKVLDVLFLPSTKLCYLLPKKLHARATDLPPGHDMTATVERVHPASPEDLRILYVGGVSQPVYDLTPILIMGKQCRVTICTRKEEWPKWRDVYGSLADNVTVVHLFGEELKRAYSEHNMATVALKNFEYLNFAMPNKMFEAIGHNIPLLATTGTMMGDFIADNSLGWTMNSDLSDFNPAKMVREYGEVVGNMVRLKPAHQWTVRAEKVVRMLS